MMHQPEEWATSTSPAAEVQHYSFMGVWSWLTTAQQHNVPLQHMHQHHQALLRLHLMGMHG
jgi:hypothetical protein